MRHRNMDDYPFDMQCTTGSAVDWYLERMKLSGITESVARKCGFRLRAPEDDVIHIEIPYFTFDGTRTTLTRHRNRDCVKEYGPSQSGGGSKGKYSQPKKSKNQVYWPPLTDQTQEFVNPACPLIVCEGEFKAICCKMHILAQGEGHEALVCGVPGTALDDDVKNMLKQIRCRGAGSESRDVFLALDWNAKGQSKERASKLEFELKQLFQFLGAQVYVLRWPIGKGAEEQKLDDWLVAGGDIGAAMDESHQIKRAFDTQLESMWDYLNTNYCIMHGNYIPLSNMAQKYTITQLTIMEPQITIPISAKKELNAHGIWNLQPKADRNEVDGYVFLPAPLGVEPDRYVHEDGVRLLNTAPPAHWIVPPWGADVPDCGPFLDLLHRLCQDNADWFLNFLAHCAQYPAQRGSHIIIFKDEGGTGKSRLFETLDLVFGKYSGPIGDALSSSFNAMLEHLVIAWWSDPVIHGGFDRDLESALKNFSGDSKLAINHKGGAKYVVRGYGRLIIATNKDWVVPVSTKERRFVVFGGLAPMDHHDAGAYMDWLAHGGVDAIRLLLTQRDLSHFDIHEQGPRTEQRAAMEKASATPLIRMLDCEPFTDRDIWSTDEISRHYNEQTGRKISNEAIGKELAKIGAIKKLVKVGGAPTRLNAVRDFTRWEEASGAEWAEEFKKPRY